MSVRVLVSVALKDQEKRVKIKSEEITFGCNIDEGRCCDGQHWHEWEEVVELHVEDEFLKVCEKVCLRRSNLMVPRMS